MWRILYLISGSRSTERTKAKSDANGLHYGRLGTGFHPMANRIAPTRCIKSWQTPDFVCPMASLYGCAAPDLLPCLELGGPYLVAGEISLMQAEKLAFGDVPELFAVRGVDILPRP